MAVLRKIALGFLLAAAAGVLMMACWEFWNYRQSAFLPLNQPGADFGDDARILNEHMDLLTKRVGDMELLVLILLGASGAYAVVFVISSYFSATSFARQADQTVANMQDQIGLAMGDLRELQEQTEGHLREMMFTAASAAIPATPQEVVPSMAPPDWLNGVAGIARRLEARQGRQLNEKARLELVEDEYKAIQLELSAGAAGPALAEVYLGFARIYASSDPARSRFFLERALGLAAPESALASRIHYQLACLYASSHDFPQAVRELAAAFEHQFKNLDETLAGDIEEGGKLYELASTAPFDKAVNDLLLNMSIGIG